MSCQPDQRLARRPSRLVLPSLLAMPVPPSVPGLGRRMPLPSAAIVAGTSGLPAPVAILYVLAALVLCAASVVIMARLRGWDPEWVARVRHSWSEAGYRVSGVWSEFGDWLRLGP